MATSFILKFDEIDNNLLQKIISMYPETDIQIISSEVDITGEPISKGFVSKSRFTPSEMSDWYVTWLKNFYHQHDVMFEIKEISGIETLLPRHKSDIARVEKLIKIGYPAVEPYLNELFEWLQDGNWPVFNSIASFLASIGLPVTPCVKEILQGRDDIWKMWVLRSVVDKNLEVANALYNEIEKIANNPTEGEKLEDTQEVAIEIYNKIRKAGN